MNLVWVRMITANDGQNIRPVIFLAEDDEHILYLFGFLLERQGYLIESAHDGFKFLDLVKASLPKYRLAPRRIYALLVWDQTTMGAHR